MAKNLVYVGIAALAIIALVLGYKIYQQQVALKTEMPPSNQQVQKKSTSQPLTNQTTSGAAIQQSADEREVLNFPGPNATAAEIKAHSDLVNKLGNQSGLLYLDISRCKPKPVVYRVKQGDSFKVKNSDQIEHTIYADATRKTQIPPNAEQTLSSKAIGDSLGDYGYNCDSTSSSVGIIQIIP